MPGWIREEVQEIGAVIAAVYCSLLYCGLYIYIYIVVYSSLNNSALNISTDEAFIILSSFITVRDYSNAEGILGPQRIPLGKSIPQTFWHHRQRYLQY